VDDASVARVPARAANVATTNPLFFMEFPP